MEKYVLKNIKRPDQHLIEAFEQLDVSTVYEAQGKLGLMESGFIPVIPETLLVGPAVTVICPAGDNLMIHAAIEVCKPGDVLVIATIGEFEAGMIGELIVTALIKKGVKGVIIDSGIRDAVQLRDMNFPVWCRAITSRGTTKNRGGWVNAPAACGGVSVQPGDLILADDDGVVVVKQEDLEQTLDASHKRLEKERQTKEKIANGQISVDFYNLRPLLENEGVRYCETQEELLKP